MPTDQKTSDYDKRYSSQLCCGLVRLTGNGARAFCNKCGWEGPERVDMDVVTDDALAHPRTPRSGR